MCEKYFNIAYSGNWRYTNRSKVDFWKKNGVKDVEKYLKDYKIIIKN